VYFWSANNSKVTKLCEYADDAVCSVSWASSGKHIAVGNTSGEVDVFDAENYKLSELSKDIVAE